MSDLSYAEHTMASIVNQCEARNIPEKDLPKVMKALEKKWGMKFDKMGPPALRRVNQQLADFFFDYLGGQKRA